MEGCELCANDLSNEFEANCPFKDEPQTAPPPDDENPPDDDLDGAQAVQENDGGKLGDNLESGSKGLADGGPFPVTIKDYLYQQSANDTTRGRKTMIFLSDYRDAKAGLFPFTVAAHHIIPGNASLKKSGLYEFMKDGGSVNSMGGRSYTIKGHIGYDVNGSHNGVWLPGNYAIKTALPERKAKDGRTLSARTGTSPVANLSWGSLKVDYEDWQFAYVAGATKAANGAFHDSHAYPYSDSVLKELNKIATALYCHLDLCKKCKEKNEVPPPFRIKRRVYALSARLRGYLIGGPGAWRRVWFPSQRWVGRIFDSQGRVTREFRWAYASAKETNPKSIEGYRLASEK